MNAPALRLDGVACARGGRLLFRDLNVALGAGEAALVTGPNGAGKSSLLRLCAGLLQCAAGTVAIGGERALLAEATALDVERPLRAALDFWARLDGGTGRVTAAIETAGLAGLEPVPVRLFSTGQRKRAALARTIASGASIWLLDEPVNGLDAEGAAMLARVIAEHRAGGGIAVVASHVPVDLPDAVPIALGAAA